jgi:LmbE family N-acetylglucosaminyl deacetylase
MEDERTREDQTIMIGSTSTVAALGTVLGIWAHTDDEAYLSGGLMAMARDHGSRVVCVTATRGELGTPDPVSWPPHRLAATRTVELAHADGTWLVVEPYAADAVDDTLNPIGRVAAQTPFNLVYEIRP